MATPETSLTKNEVFWAIPVDAASEADSVRCVRVEDYERLRADRDHWEKMARTPAEDDPLAVALAEMERLRAELAHKEAYYAQFHLEPKGAAHEPRIARPYEQRCPFGGDYGWCELGPGHHGPHRIPSKSAPEPNDAPGCPCHGRDIPGCKENCPGQNVVTSTNEQL